MQHLPAVLQYGLTGLAAVIALLAYKLLLHQSAKERPNQSILKTIKSFMVLGVVLAIISLVSSSIELAGSLSHEREVSSLKADLVSKDAEIKRLRDAAGSQDDISKLKQSLLSAESEIERLKSSTVGQQTITELRSELSRARESLLDLERSVAVEREVLSRLVADEFELELNSTFGKLHAVPDDQHATARCLLLKRAVFLRMFTFEANPTILRNALMHLVQRGHSSLQPCVEDWSATCRA